MKPGYDKPLYLLAFDHRGSFQKELVPEPERVADAKRVIYEAFLEVAGPGPLDDVGILVDEQFGADIARSAKEAGYALAMPAERSGQAEFDFEYGRDFDEHIEAFDPDFVKVLVRHNPDDPGASRARQIDRLAVLSYWLRGSGRKLMVELLVPPTPAQLEAFRGNIGDYDSELRPVLMLEAIGELQNGGVEPDIWKIEGLDRRADYARMAEQARSGGRDRVSCIVLGRGADEDRVLNWLVQSAGLPGYIGFAVGRTLWWNELRAYTAGRLPRAVAVRRIAENFARLIDAYTLARVPARLAA